jgi:hypothetical protein
MNSFNTTNCVLSLIIKLFTKKVFGIWNRTLLFLVWIWIHKLIPKKFEDIKGQSEDKLKKDIQCNGQKGQTSIYKTLHRNLQQES